MYIFTQTFIDMHVHVHVLLSTFCTHTQHSKSRETSFTKPELKRGTSRTDLIRQLSKQRSFIEQAEAAEAEKKNVLIVKEAAETGSVGPHELIPNF